MSKYVCRLDLPAMKRSDLGRVIDLEELAVEFAATTKVAMTSTSCRGCRFTVQWTLFGGRTLESNPSTTKEIIAWSHSLEFETQPQDAI